MQPTSTSTPSSATPDWHYVEGGQKIGPVTPAQLRDLAMQGKITRDTRVWRQGMPDWVPASQTGLSKFLPAVTEPPAITGDAVPNQWVWWLAFAPMIGAVIQVVYSSFSGGFAANYWWFTIAVNIAIVSGDVNILKKGGHFASGLKGWALLIPVYLFKRASLLRQSSGYAWVWVAMFFASNIYLSYVAENQNIRALTSTATTSTVADSVQAAPSIADALLRSYNQNAEKMGLPFRCVKADVAPDGDGKLVGVLTLQDGATTSVYINVDPQTGTISTTTKW